MTRGRLFQFRISLVRRDPILMAYCRVILATVICLATIVPVAADERIDFTRQVRPILAANCLHCHGQDPSHREAELRLDVFEAPDDETAGAESVIAPGDVE